MEGRCYIGGQWVTTDGSFAVTDPATGEVVGTAAEAGSGEAHAAIDAASKAFSAWVGTTATQRGAVLRRISAALLDDADRIADLIVAEQGKPRAPALFEVRYATEWLDWFGEEGRRTYGEVIPPAVAGKRLIVLRQPVGVAITPWNFPVAMIALFLGMPMSGG